MDQGGSSPEGWYFVRLAFLAIPWESRHSKRAEGTLFKQYYLVRAENIKSAFAKADRILSVSEHCDGDGVLNGKRVVFRKIGILDLEPLYEPLRSGVELFDESEIAVSATEATKHVVTSQKRARMIAREKKEGRQSLVEPYWGEGFDDL